MRTSVLALGVLILLGSTGSAFAAFAGAYAPEYWTFYSDGDGCGGTGAGELYPDLMIVEGVDCETGHCTLCLAHYLLTAPADATLSFHYLFTSTDSGAWDYVDRAFYLLNGELTTRGHDVDGVVMEMLEQMRAEEYEIITVYHGEATSAREVERLADRIRAEYPEQEVELVNGGQPHYHYILSAE